MPRSGKHGTHRANTKARRARGSHDMRYLRKRCLANGLDIGPPSWMAEQLARLDDTDAEQTTDDENSDTSVRQPPRKPLKPKVQIVPLATAPRAPLKTRSGSQANQRRSNRPPPPVCIGPRDGELCPKNNYAKSKGSGKFRARCELCRKLRQTGESVSSGSEYFTAEEDAPEDLVGADCVDFDQTPTPSDGTDESDVPRTPTKPPPGLNITIEPELLWAGRQTNLKLPELPWAEHWQHIPL